MCSIKLHLAAGRNNVSQVRALLSQGVDVNERGCRGETALHHVVVNNFNESHFTVIEVLLKNGIDVNALDEQGLPALWYLLEQCNLKMLQLFLSFNADFEFLTEKEKRNLLYPVIVNKNMDVLQQLINLGLNVNYTDYLGNTPVHWACDSVADNEYVFKNIKCLLQNGANMSAVNQFELSSLTRALSSYLEFDILNKKEDKKILNFIMDHCGHQRWSRDRKILLENGCRISCKNQNS